MVVVVVVVVVVMVMVILGSLRPFIAGSVTAIEEHDSSSSPHDTRSWLMTATNSDHPQFHFERYLLPHSGVYHRRKEKRAHSPKRAPFFVSFDIHGEIINEAHSLRHGCKTHPARTMRGRRSSPNSPQTSTESRNRTCRFPEVEGCMQSVTSPTSLKTKERKRK